MVKALFLVLLICSSLISRSQSAWMNPNAGQWDDKIEYKIDLSIGEMLIEKDGFGYVLHNGNELNHNHHDQENEVNDEIKGQFITEKFVNSTWSGQKTELDRSNFYENYFLGSDKSKWKSEVYSFSKVKYHDFFQGVDLEMETNSDAFKYSFRLKPHTNFEIIKSVLTGHSYLRLENGDLKIGNVFGEIIEEKPVAWNVIDGKNVAVEIEFTLEGDTLGYRFPKGYNSNYELVIDPNITFSTFTGSTADNWGFTATPDEDGNLFGGGVVFNVGYPVSPGAFDPTFNGGTIDIGLSKFNTTGTTMLFSTYIGGSGSETPNSIVCSQSGELFIFGITSSSNFPMAGSSYDNSYNGGPSISNSLSNSLNFTLGTDLFVARINATGTNLLASTFIGGTGTDGINTTSLKYNYGDQFRGEIILDNAGFVYIASVTSSSDFPTVFGSQNALNGAQDAVLFKMPIGLNALSFSTYFGGSGLETGNSVQIGSNGSVYMVGGTTSSNLPLLIGQDLTFDGVSDGYVARFNGTTGAVLSGNYIGSSEYDQAYMVQLDIDDNVYIFGQTESDLGVTPGCFGVPNSGQFIRKYDGLLSSIQWNTMIGSASGHVEISPTAFLVSDCYDIYLSGWGGDINSNPNLSQAVFSSSNGFPTTSDAFQSTTNGSNFYIAVLGPDASSLKYGTYMGGTASSFNHVDGGTSRFDKAGRIYHAVCGACGGNPNGFSTTPGVWSPVNSSSNCNLAAFKFELSTIEATVAAPDPLICLPDPVIFNNNSANGNSFFWDFGDNTTSTQVNPSHLYPGPGLYTVTLVVSDTNNCFSTDSVLFEVNIGDFQGGVITPTSPVCPGSSYQMEAFGGSFYAWTPAEFLDDPTSDTPIATVTTSTDFMVIISDSCGIDTAYVTLPVFGGISSISNDTSICIGNSVDLHANGGDSYTWSPIDFLDNPNISNPISTPTNNILYYVDITTLDGCMLRDSVQVDVYYDPPVPIMPDSLWMCLNSEIDILASGGDTYLWSPNLNISSLVNPLVTVNPANSIYYYCDFTNACGTVRDSTWIEVVEASINAFNDTIICPDNSVPIWVSGGVNYLWWPAGTLSTNNTSLTIATPVEPTMYYVRGQDIYGCEAFDSVFVDLFPRPFIQTNPDVYAFYGDMIQLSATSSTPGAYTWSPVEFLSCVGCVNPIANPNQNYQYTVSYTDGNGCSASDIVSIHYDPLIFVPNTFTPDNNSFNDFFKAQGGNIKTFKMDIYNRWGELIITLNDIDEVWDGRYDNQLCPDGTYTWKIVLTSFEDEEYNYVGHVNLLR